MSSPLLLSLLLLVEESSFWFTLRSKKTMYFMAKSYSEKLKWVNTIQSILSQNTQQDPMFSDNRTALANTLIDEYNRYHCRTWNSSGRISSKSFELSEAPAVGTSAATTHCSTSTYTQANWWKLLPELISYSSQDGQETEEDTTASSAVTGHSSLKSTQSLSRQSSLSHLLSVIQFHQEEVVDSILSLLDDNTSSGSSGNLSLISSLLTIPNKHQHYPIASGWFYEGNPKISTFSNQDLLRPILLRVFLFHDLLLVTTVPTKDSNAATSKLSYYFHIHLHDLQVLDYLESLSFPSSSQSAPSSSSSSSPAAKTTKGGSGTGDRENSQQVIASNDQESFLATSQQRNTQQQRSGTKVGAGGFVSCSLGIKLIDHSVKSKGFFSSLWSSGSSRERIFLASTMEQKLSWVELLTEAIRSLRNLHSPFHRQSQSHRPVVASPEQEDSSSTSPSSAPSSARFLIRRISSCGDGAWKYDERVSESEKTVDTLL
jgi:hypothetical protein